jgi:dTDP-glucose 4,6-dehydratase
MTISNALEGKTIPVYGNGRQVRNWIYVEDFCEAIKKVLLHGRNIVYTAGGPEELENIEVISKILQLTNNNLSLVSYVDDRLAHDFRYSLNSSRLENELDWHPQVIFDKGIDRTIEFYKNKER